MNAGLRRLQSVLNMCAKGVLLTLAVLVAALGVRSYFVTDVIGINRADPAAYLVGIAEQFHSHKGKVLFYRNSLYFLYANDPNRKVPVPAAPTRVNYWRVRDTSEGWGVWESPDQKDVFVDRWHGFNFGGHEWRRYTWRLQIGTPTPRNPDGTLNPGNAISVHYIWFVSLPHWFLALVLGLWPTLSLVRHVRRRRRARLGHCPHCDYDLRAHTATPDARCPECGQPVTPPAATASTT